MVLNQVFHLRLRIAFKWMVRAFSGYLSTDQLLLLWDRILGYESLEIVAGGSYYIPSETRCLNLSVEHNYHLSVGQTSSKLIYAQ